MPRTEGGRLPRSWAHAPCFNPVREWPQEIIRAYTKIKEALPEITVSIIIVDDGSTLNISEGIKMLREKIPTLKFEGYSANKGKGAAVRKGVALSTADIVIYTDIDFPYEEKGLVELYKALNHGRCDIALDTRDDKYYDNVPAARSFMSKLLKQVIRVMLNLPTADTQAGLKGFNQKGKGIFMQTTINRYLFDLEFLKLAASHKNLAILCLPVTLKQGIQFSQMRWPVLLKESLNFLKILMQR